MEFVPERAHAPRNCSRMETAADYRKLAEECRRLARRAEDEQHKAVLEQMAEVWLRLAVEAEQKRPRKSTLNWLHPKEVHGRAVGSRRQGATTPVPSAASRLWSERRRCGGRFPGTAPQTNDTARRAPSAHFQFPCEGATQQNAGTFRPASRGGCLYVGMLGREPRRNREEVQQQSWVGSLNVAIMLDRLIGVISDASSSASSENSEAWTSLSLSSEITLVEAVTASWLHAKCGCVRILQQSGRHYDQSRRLLSHRRKRDREYGSVSRLAIRSRRRAAVGTDQGRLTARGAAPCDP